MRTSDSVKERERETKKPLDTILQVPKSWSQTAGLLRHKKKALAAHLKRIRSEWS